MFRMLPATWLIPRNDLNQNIPGLHLQSHFLCERSPSELAHEVYDKREGGII